MSGREFDYLWNAVRLGDEKAFDFLVKEQYPNLCNFANRILNNLPEAEEVVQDAFVKLWQNKDQIDLKNSLKSYLYQAVHNLAINKLDYLKTNKFKPNKTVSQEQWLHIHNSYTIDDTTVQMLEATETEALINKAIDKLPEKCREVFLLSRYDLLSYEEISDKLQLSQNTIRVQIFRALEFIQAFIKKNNQ
jgi:RNA polymerase sigma-70 factor (ECF subfamily)